MSSSSLSKTLYRYGRDPVSMTLLVCVIVSAVITFLSLAFLLGYILLQGIPNINLDLFAFEYNTENVSLFPALVDTVIMVLLALAIATPLGIFAAIYLVEYASRDNKIVGVVRVTADTFVRYSFYCLRFVRHAVLCNLFKMELLATCRLLHGCNYDFAADYAYYRRSVKSNSR